MTLRTRPRTGDDSVPALSVQVQRTVRFEEVDAMGIMWHGRYAGWLEDGREALGGRYGIAYLDFFEKGVLLPIKLLHLDFRLPLRYRQECAVVARLLWNDAALLEYEYDVLDDEGRIATRARTTQLMTGTGGELLLERPPFYESFCARWRAGDLPA
ncbi:MAG: acyl-CoA thioesterase [Desulfovibrio sp.]|nr:acyl-CoA thioesterase [Desulfovibrio sp.]